MSSQQSLIPVTSYLLSSHWSLEPGDIRQIENHLNLPAAPKPILSIPWWKKPTTCQPYKAGDPIFLGRDSIPCTFEGFTGRRSRNIAGEYVQMASFQTCSNVHPVYNFNILLYPGEVIELNQTSTHSSFWRYLRGYLGGCFH